ncbi:hypothetical protein THASP1DRAFT_33718 [Thamnocephalis sphaerospora]|uniref:Uncharacterized protein n=1 Tax=Thamnocephalis sphaerospora TaxID=78915 RepID=A0A4P9XG19_9FUNG|nr:hypothetical protein THASP1DRAFT_33718 [Thamnocephalis sphaerospora]|eukprot:RKP04508.1 hypothetical protein THASP1DRAFT_33718 [Thamnocephalis sphaerospora]
MRNYIQLVLAACALATPLLAHAAPTPDDLPELWLRVMDVANHKTAVQLYSDEQKYTKIEKDFSVSFSAWKTSMELMCDKDRDGDAFCLKLSPNGSSDKYVNTVAEVRYKDTIRRCALRLLDVYKNPKDQTPDYYECTFAKGQLNA